jgi:hypothetical protein
VDKALAKGVDAVAIRRAVNTDLLSLSSAVIILQRMYPACPTTLERLEGTDAVLYEVLQDRYDVQVVYAILFRPTDNGGEPRCGGRGMPDATVHDGADSELVILSPIHPHCCLGTSSFPEGAGHESSVEKMVYVVTRLQVSHEA